eukprot:4035508-Prymnesium_polylepis.1
MAELETRHPRDPLGGAQSSCNPGRDPLGRRVRKQDSWGGTDPVRHGSRGRAALPTPLAGARMVARPGGSGGRLGGLGSKLLGGGPRGGQ